MFSIQKGQSTHSSNGFVLRNQGVLVGIAICVALANSALAQTGSLTSKKAYDFWNSTGVQLHADFGTKCYSNYPKMNSDIANLGIAHVRDGLGNVDPHITWMGVKFADPNYVNEIKTLESSYGITAFLTWDWNGSFGSAGQSQISGSNWVYIGNDIKAYQPAIDSIEVNNEPDLSGITYSGTGFPTGMFWQTSEMANVILWNGITGVQLVAPPCGESVNYTPRGVGGGLKSDVAPGYANTYGGGHYYPNLPDAMPDSAWGSYGTSPGTLASAISDSQTYTGSNPIYNGETGIDDYDFNGDQTVEGFFEPLLYVEHFRQGIARTSLYELYDEPGITGREGHWGIMNCDGSNNSSPKPAYSAIKNMMAIVKDTNPASFTPSNVLYSLTGYPSANPNIHYQVIESSDQNTWYLLIWNNVSIWNNTTKTHISPTSEKAVATVATIANHTFTVYAPGESSGTNPTTAFTAWATGNAIALNVPAELLIVEIK